MAYAIRDNGEWREIQTNEQIVFESTAYSYATMLTWPERQKELRGIFLITESEIPDGKIPTGSTLVDHKGQPVREWTLEDAPVVPVTVVSKAQAKLALLDAGLLDTVETALGSMEDAEGQRARIEWNDRTEFHRDHQFIGMLAAVIGLSNAQIDDLFEKAAQL